MIFRKNIETSDEQGKFELRYGCHGKRKMPPARKWYDGRKSRMMTLPKKRSTQATKRGKTR